ncbi:RagB/SusD family nutrient uptake outer membrane protein [uncultured Draconibacterium sp.]|uniref:RagB/SusD family nutrient uptake outer membrane protein n=1 Tax=uncultured Draconibacterium sp. TaxID=1573823 RepID=UPI003261B683
MKKIFNKTIVVLLLSTWFFTACDLDEVNPSTVSPEVAYTDPEGFESLVNYCYDGLYYFYGKIDGIGPLEMGTDLWISESKESAFTLYNSTMNTEQSKLKVFWQGMYSTVNYCNTAIYFADQVEGYTEEEKNRKVAEAYFLRAWSNFNIVEQFGGVVLRTEPSIVTGADNYPERSTEAEFYDLIISDLKFACDHLPVDQGYERGRVAKKAAYGMLAKVYLQRTRLGESNASEYANLALEAALELIDNQEAYGVGLYDSDDSISGYSKLWDGRNNKTNKEYLFLEAVDHETFFNPDWSNRGRTRQYYLMDLKRVGAEWGTTEKYCSWYGRANDRGFKPTRYLLTELFEPVKDPADTRFKETFFTEYYNSRWKDHELKQEVIDKYQKDPSLVGHVIKNTVYTIFEDKSYYAGKVNASGTVNMVDEDEDGYLDGLSVFTPNYTIAAEEKAKMPFLCVDPSDMFEANGKWVTSTTSEMGTYYKDCYPSMRKYSSLFWIYNNQKWQGDIAILRLGEVYLIAAEAALRSSDNKAKAAELVNVIRQRCAVTSRASEMVVAQADVDLDFLLEERARELAGEQTRWYDLKRYGKLTNSYFAQTNPDIVDFNESKHTIRPIPQTFLDAIANPDEFGTNGY